MLPGQAIEIQNEGKSDYSPECLPNLSCTVICNFDRCTVICLCFHFWVHFFSHLFGPTGPTVALTGTWANCREAWGHTSGMVSLRKIPAHLTCFADPVKHSHACPSFCGASGEQINISKNDLQFGSKLCDHTSALQHDFASEDGTHTSTVDMVGGPKSF